MPDQKQSPIELLHKLEQHCLKVAKGLPQREDIRDVWTGIGFRVGEINLVAPLNQVNEILLYPSLTNIPGTKGWIKGVANVRGTLLTVTDLNLYLGRPATTIKNNTRMVIYRRDELAAGLLVDEIQGLKHFSDDDKITSVTKFEESLRPYVRGAFRQNDMESLVFSMHALAEDPEFFHVAV